MSDADRSNPVAQLVRAAAQVERNEVWATVLAFSMVFVLMTSYALLKPLRDALAGDWGNVGLALTWTANFGLSLVAVSAYGAALTYVRFRVMVPGVYLFFAATFFGLFVIRAQGLDPGLVNKGFYVWVSVFSLFNLSVFWSFMTEVFNREQARRLFGIFAAGTTLGAIVGPVLTASLIGRLGDNGLLLLASLLMLYPVAVIPPLRRLKDTRLGNAGRGADLGRQQALGTNPFSGFSLLTRDSYLLGISAFILLYVTINTFVYFELQDLTREYSLEFRARIWSAIEITTNVLTLVVVAFVTGRVVIRFGMPVALTIMPALVALGVLALVAMPVLLMLAVFQVGRRVGNYAVTRPSREMLFTVLGREVRFKAKPVIDVVIYRAGDVMTAWLFTLLVGAFQLGLAGVALAIGGVALAWGLVAVWLGRRYSERTAPKDNRLPEGATSGDAA